MDELVTARWWKPREGALTVEPATAEGGEEEPYLVVHESWAGEAHDPLAIGDSALFRQYATRVTNAESAWTFAVTYGILGRWQPVRLADGRALIGEPVSQWVDEAAAMRRAIGLWEALRDDDLPALRRDPHVAAWPRFGGEGRPADDVTARQLGRLALTALVNHRLEAEVAPVLEVEGDRLVFHNQARTLIGAMWLQLALAIHGNKQYRACPVDGVWWEVEPDIARTSKVYCSNKCKQQAWRERRAGGVA